MAIIRDVASCAATATELSASPPSAFPSPFAPAVTAAIPSAGAGRGLLTRGLAMQPPNALRRWAKCGLHKGSPSAPNS
eukprot:scaffold309020_cov39-Tisochrysis_lutea.AAC.1